MSPSPAAVDHQRHGARLADLSARAAARAWAAIDPADIRGSWRAQLAALVVTLAGAQLAAAQSTEPYLLRLLGPGVAPPAADRLDPRALAGVTVDGRPLAPLLDSPVLRVLALIGRGVPLSVAFAAGRLLLDLTVRTVIADTARAADQVGMGTRPAVTSYIRVVSGGACSRCLVLAGAQYGISSGFARHPRCACGMEPVTRDHRPQAQDPRRLFDAMSPEQQRRRFGEAGADAIREGADIGQVVNARRGMESAGAYRRRLTAETTEGTTRRGIYFRREFARLQAEGAIPAGRSPRGVRLSSPRLTPEEIYRRATSRTHAVELLHRYGYLI